MQTGLTLSVIGHAGLIAVALFGGWLQSEDLPPPEVADVSIVTEEEFAALSPRAEAPEIVDSAPAIEPAPEPPQDEPPLPQTPEPEPEAPPDLVPPEAAAPPQPEAPPEPPAPLAAPEADVTDTAPDVPAPPPTDADLPSDLVSVPRPAPRIAREVAPPPPPEAESAPEVVERTTPAPAEETPQPVEEVAPAAPEEATTETVTEAEQPSTAPVRSVRPPARPARPRRAAEATEGSATAADSSNVAAEPVDTPSESPGSGSADIPLGPPMTFAETDAFRVAVQRCWNVGSLSSAAQATIVTVGFEMSRDGKPIASTMTLINSAGGDSAAAKQAFEAARRAILRCGATGYDLPDEKFGQWRGVEITFDPREMRLR